MNSGYLLTGDKEGHCFVKQVQEKYFQDTKTDVSSNVVILPMAFYENFEIVNQDKI